MRIQVVNKDHGGWEDIADTHAIRIVMDIDHINNKAITVQEPLNDVALRLIKVTQHGRDAIQIEPEAANCIVVS